MRHAVFQENIRTAFIALIDIGLSSWDLYRTFKGTEVNSAFRKVALNPASSYERIFLTGLRYRAYNFLLNDSSFFQFWSDGISNSKKLRFSFYPNPYGNGKIELPDEDSGENDFEFYYQLIGEESLQIRVPHIRYDLSVCDHVSVEHPASHLTIGGDSENRWPLSIILTPKIFCLFICKQYYPKYWMKSDSGEDIGGGFKNVLDKWLAEEKDECVELVANYFTEQEKRQLYFG